MTDYQAALVLLDQFIARSMKTLNAPGIAIGLTDRERTLWAAGYGFADLTTRTPVRPETLFEIGSIGKSFASVVLLQLQQEGRLDVHQAVARYLPWFRVKSRYAPITLHHLMSHTAGISDGADGISTLFDVWAMREMEATTPPGTMFHYSNAGYKALGLVLEEVLGQPIDEIYRERVFDPLDMSASEPRITNDTRRRLAVGYEAFYGDRPLPRGGHLAPATWVECDGADGSICSTVVDMAAYLRMLLNRGRGPQGRVLSEESFGLLTQHIIQTKDEVEGAFYGYGVDVGDSDGYDYIGHDGGMVGYVSVMQGDLDEGLGVVILTNGPSDPGAVGEYSLQLLRAARQGRELPALPGAVDPFCVVEAAQYAGSYKARSRARERVGERALVFVAEGERLFLQCDDERFALELQQGDRFLVHHPDFALFPIHFGWQAGQVVEAFNGADWYVNERYNGPESFDYPPEWEAFAGHYASYNPWLSHVRIVLRKGALVLIYASGSERALVPLQSGGFRVGKDERSPERLSFNTIVNGQAMRANLSGGELLRTFAP